MYKLAHKQHKLVSAAAAAAVPNPSTMIDTCAWANWIVCSRFLVPASEQGQLLASHFCCSRFWHLNHEWWNRCRAIDHLRATFATNKWLSLRFACSICWAKRGALAAAAPTAFNTLIIFLPLDLWLEMKTFFQPSALCATGPREHFCLMYVDLWHCHLWFNQVC